VLGGLFVLALAFFSLLFGLYMYTRYMPEPFRSYLGVPSRERPVLFGGSRRRK
jgi:hypothetical protein